MTIHHRCTGVNKALAGVTVRGSRNPQKTLTAIVSLFLASCGGVIPFPYPQTAPIPLFSGRVLGLGSETASVQLQGHPETRTSTDRNGNFVTREGSEFYFGMDQAYFPRNYRLTASKNGRFFKSWQIKRPGLIGYYKGQPNYDNPIKLGDLR